MQRTKSLQESHITELMHEYVETKENEIVPNLPALQLANTLTLLIETLFKGQNKYILELLQNADDAVEEKSLEKPFIEFILSGNRLIVRHNGRPFKHQDVKKICANASPDGDKSDDIKKIGYKGIGFKAIFSISNRVTIISGGYQFRFDKTYWVKKCKDYKHKPVPWPLIPIWTEIKELKTSIQDQIKDSKMTYFIIEELRDREKIQNELDDLEKKPESLLFLRNIRRTILRSNQDLQIEVKEHHPKREIHLHTPSKKEVRVFLQSRIFSPKINSDTQSQIMELSDFECPPRLKKLEHVNIQFVVPLDSKDHIATKDRNLLYCYLPTQMELSVPYMVNSDFLLDADRTRLLDNAWNHFLFNGMVWCHFRWLKELVEAGVYRDQILHLVGSKTITGADRFQNSYRRGFEAAQNSKAFVPSYPNPEKLLTLKESIVDRTDFWRMFPEFKDDNYPREFIVRYELERLEQEYETYDRYSRQTSFNGHFSKIFNISTLLRSLANYAKQSKEISVQIRLIQYLYERAKSKNLQDIEFLLCADEIFRKPKDIYLSAETKLMSGLPKTVHVPLLHSEILLGLSKKVQKWLLSYYLGMKEFSSFALINDKILSYLSHSSQQKQDEHLQIFAFLYQQLILNFDDSFTEQRKILFKSMHEIYVLNVLNRFVPITQCFFSDDYKPINPLNEHVNEERQLSAEYLKLRIPGATVENLRDFFHRLGVKQNAFVLRVRPYSYEEAQREQNTLAQNYFESLDSYVSSTSKVSLFLDMPILDRQKESEKFVRIFWEKLVSNWESIKSDLPKIQYQGTRVISFLEYRLKHQASLYFNGKYFKSTKFFTADFAEFKILPTLPEDLPADLIVFLGAKSQLNFNDVIKILNSLSKQPRPNPRLYTKVFRSLLELVSQSSNYDLQTLRTWSGKLPAQDDTLKPIKELQCFALPDLNQPAPKSSLWLKEFPDFSRAEIQRIAELFGMTVRVRIQGRINFTEAKEDSSPLKAFRIILPAIALLEHELYKEKSATEGLNELLIKFRTLTAYSVKELKIDIEGDVQNVTCQINGNNLYFKGSWEGPKIVDIFATLAKFLNLSPRIIENARKLTHGYKSSEALIEWVQENNLSEAVYQQLNQQLNEPILEKKPNSKPVEWKAQEGLELEPETLLSEPHRKSSEEKSNMPSDQEIKEVDNQCDSYLLYVSEKNSSSTIASSVRGKAGELLIIDLTESLSILTAWRHRLSLKQSQSPNDQTKEEIERVNKLISQLENQQLAVSNESKQQSSSISTYEEVKVPGDGHCLYSAVGIYVGQDQKQLRRKVADELETKLQTTYAAFLELKSQQTPKQYIKSVRHGSEWAGNAEITALMHVLRRPIIVVRPGENPKVRVKNPTEEERQYSDKGLPILVSYNGKNHYNALILVVQNDSHTVSSQNHQNQKSLETMLVQLIKDEKLSKKNAYVFIRSKRDFFCIYVKNGIPQPEKQILLKPNSRFDRLESLIFELDKRPEKSGYFLLMPEAIQLIISNTNHIQLGSSFELPVILDEKESKYETKRELKNGDN